MKALILDNFELRSNEFPRGNMFHAGKLYSRSRSRIREQVFLVCRVYSVSTDNILCVYVKCNVPHKGVCLRMDICACYTWEITLNFGLLLSFDNM
jgi:hypothetical protein